MNERDISRLAVLLRSASTWKGNYTEARYVAEQVIAEAEKVGWRLEISVDDPEIVNKPIKST